MSDKRTTRSTNKIVKNPNGLKATKVQNSLKKETESEPAVKKLKLDEYSGLKIGAETVLKEKKNEFVKIETNENEQEGKVALKRVYPLLERLKSGKFLGFHASIAGGVWKSIEEAEGCRALSYACFLRSQRMWNCKPLEKASIQTFKEKLEESWISPSMILPHGSYLLNCGSSDPEILRKSRDGLVDEVRRCEHLGIPLYNFHPGSAKNSNIDECIELIAQSINMAHQQTSSVATLIENMCCQGKTIGGKFDQLKRIIDKVVDQSRIGVCLDTCHAFAAGYDLSSEKGYEDTKKEFDQIIGRKYLKAVHLNDSKGALNCHLDRHENIGKGKLGMPFFKRFMNDAYFSHIPVILETPECDYGKEIDLLYSLVEE